MTLHATNDKWRSLVTEVSKTLSAPLAALRGLARPVNFWKSSSLMIASPSII